MTLQAILSKGVQHSSPMVRYVTLSTLGHLLRALEPIVSDMDRAMKLMGSGHPKISDADGSGQPGQKEAAAEWEAAAGKLRSSIRSRLPDPQALLALYVHLESRDPKVGGAASDGVKTAAGAGRIPTSSFGKDVDVDIDMGADVDEEDVSATEVRRGIVAGMHAHMQAFLSYQYETSTNGPHG